MTSPRPQLKSADIIYELNNYFVEGIRPTPFKIKKLKNDAHKIMKHDHVNAYVILGIIACIENDIINMHRYHKNAINLASSNLDVILQYAVSLQNSGLSEEALKIAKEAYELNKKYSPTLSVLVSSSGEISAVNENFENEFNRYADEFRDLTGEEHFCRKFNEDNEKYLSLTFDVIDELNEKKPELLIKLDENLLDEMSELVKGVDIDELG